MKEFASIWLPKAKNTVLTGYSLAQSLYTVPLTILINGDLGAGKTTFLQGFAKGLGISETLTSPTYALEQRYSPIHGLGESKGLLLHLDLYRLSQKEAGELVESSSDSHGIRCIEWAERLPTVLFQKPSIVVSLKETKNSKRNRGRQLTISFHDFPLPSRREILEWRKQVHLPKHVAGHCDAVGKFSMQLAHILLQRGVICRPLTLQKAGEVHDLFRFIDFRPGGWQEQDSTEEKRHWQHWKKRFLGLRHEAACATFLREHGYGGLADIVAVHGLSLPSPERTTIEQKILFYADKRVKLDKVVSLDKRFADFKIRYGPSSLQEHQIWYKEAKKVEMELFPRGIKRRIITPSP